MTSAAELLADVLRALTTAWNRGWSGFTSRADLTLDDRSAFVLLLGGLAMLGLLAGLLLLRTVLGGGPEVPKGPHRSVDTRPPDTVPRPERHSEAAPFRGDAEEEFLRGRNAGHRAEVRDVDEVLDRLLEADLGQPRILRVLRNLLVVRLYACRGCGANGSGPDAQPAGCPFECGFLEGAFANLLGSKVMVRETTCRGRGRSQCEFEVWS